jgi:hypothetical protein
VTGYRGDVGPIAQRLIDRATASTTGMVATVDYQEIRAARKLVRRGRFVQFGTLPFFFSVARLDELAAEVIEP